MAAALIGLGPSLAADDNLSYLAKDGQHIRVFLKEFSNESGQTQISPEDFKNSFETAMLRRKAVTFDIAKNADASDIQISCAIKKYLYSKTDPITSFGNSALVILDAITIENYAELTGEFTVVGTKTGKVIWKDSVKAFVKRTMTPKESMPLVCEKLSRAFLTKSFGKPNK